MLADSELRVFGLRIALYGVALMLAGIGLAAQLQAEPVAASSVGKEAARVISMIPSVAGAILTLWGAIRLSLFTPRLSLFVSGIGLVTAATAFPLAAAQLVPGMKQYQWNFNSLLPLFIFRISGLIFFSTAVLRWLTTVDKKTSQSHKG